MKTLRDYQMHSEWRPGLSFAGVEEHEMAPIVQQEDSLTMKIKFCRSIILGYTVARSWSSFCLPICKAHEVNVARAGLEDVPSTLPHK